MVVKTVTEMTGTTEIPAKKPSSSSSSIKEAEKVRNHLEKLLPDRTINYRPLDR